MRILFLTLYDIRSLHDRGIYEDLLRELTRRGHEVCAVSPAEKRSGVGTHAGQDGAFRLIKVRTGNIQKAGTVEKGISTLTAESIILRALKKYTTGDRFDLVLYSTPPVTLARAVDYIRRRDGARTYLMLKDIFPQNAVDIGMLKTTGISGLVYRVFRRKERLLYSVSDRIGCMSEANVRYLRTHQPQIPAEHIGICPNAAEICVNEISGDVRAGVRRRYGIPADRFVFIYGGNLGRPQGIPEMIRCIDACRDTGAYFLIAGSGTGYAEAAEFAAGAPEYVKLTPPLPRDEYEMLCAGCDCGLIFLDSRFTIPNFPSRLLSYMQASLPVICATDSATDIGKTVSEGGFGFACSSADPGGFRDAVTAMMSADRGGMSRRSAEYLRAHFDVADVCDTILAAVD